jgi:hypothetical protein
VSLYIILNTHFSAARYTEEGKILSMHASKTMKLQETLLLEET